MRQAIEALLGYYGSKADDAVLVQQPAMPEKHLNAVGAGGGIISILEVLVAHFLRFCEQAAAAPASPSMRSTRAFKRSKPRPTM